MNRRDTLKAAVGGLLGLLGVRAAKPKRTVACLEFSITADSSMFVKAMERAKRRMCLLLRLESTLTAEGPVSATVLGDSGQVVSVYGSLLRGDDTIPTGKVALAAWVSGQWQIISVEC